MNLEDFKVVVDYPNYMISPIGEVWDVGQQKLLKWIKNNDFNCVNMYNLGGKKVLTKIHQTVANTFLVKPENASKIVVHKDLNRDNNNFSNLEWKIKGESNPAHLRYSNLNGKKYHIIELENIAKDACASVDVVRNKLSNGWTIEETITGWQKKDEFFCDDLMFIGEVEFRRYKNILDRDVKRKEEDEKCRVERHKIYKTLWDVSERLRKRGTEDTLEYTKAHKTWQKMMYRCYDQSDKSYKYWGEKGATVCEEWHDPDIFCAWYIKNKIVGWDMEKDILQKHLNGVTKQYNPDNCCFVPKYINQWFAKTKKPAIRKFNRGDFGIETSVRLLGNSVTCNLYGNTEEDVLEQFYLMKDLHLSRHLFYMRKEYDVLRSGNPNSPEIHPTLISVLEKFSAEKYLSP